MPRKSLLRRPSRRSGGARPRRRRPPGGIDAAGRLTVRGAEPGSGEGLKIGYISLGDSIPFVNLVSQSLAEQAEIAGAEFVPCDSEVDAAKALACAQNLRVQEVDGLINFQLFEDAAEQICAEGSAGAGRLDRHPPAALRGRVHGRGQHARRHDPR